MTVVLSLPSGRPKRDIIELAYDDCGLAGYEFDRTPEEQTMALRKLNALMLEWPWNQLGYTQPAYGVGIAEEPSGLPDEAVNAVAQYLALRIAPGIGNTLSPEQRASMSRSLMLLQSQFAVVPSAQLPGNTVAGCGNRRRYYPFFEQAQAEAKPAAAVAPPPAAASVTDDEPDWETVQW